MTKSQEKDPARHEAPLCLGREVRCKKEFANVFVGEAGVVVGIGQIEGEPSYTLIFRGGFWDVFTASEIDLLIDVKEAIHPHLASYALVSADRLADDYRAGRIWATIPGAPAPEAA